MTLTEEQRTALKRVVAYMDEMYSVASPYHGCTEDANLLRAMIDSSEHVTEPTKMIGFDLEKVREAVHILENFAFASGKIAAGQIQDVTWGARLLATSAAEIERLRAAPIEYQNALDDVQNLKEQIETFHLRRENELRQMNEISWQNKTQTARIKELEDALVDELVKQQFWCGVIPSMDERKMVARQRLQADGKIGPDADAKPREGLYGKYRISKADGSPVDHNADYFVLRLDTDPVARRAAREYSYMTADRKLALELQKRITKYNPKMMDCINLQFFGVEKPRVWQITEGRKAAIKTLLVEMNDVPTSIHDIDLVIHAENVLRAMLREAE